MSLFVRGLRVASYYGNPFRILAQRVCPGAFRDLRIVDRQTGFACSFRPGAEVLFAEVWFHHDYDIPGVPLRPGDVVLDVGGNQGFYACYAAFQGARVFTFEPDADNRALLKKNIDDNGLGDRVTLVPCAVQARSGKTTFYTTPALGGGMNTTTPLFANHDHQQTQDVPCVSLADHIAAHQLGAIRVCKLDCEGAELEIIKGLTPELAARIDGFVMEFHPPAYPPSELIKALEELGTHHLMMAPPKAHCERSIIWAVSRTSLRAQAEHFDLEFQRF
jgi:FkbM family methyltransferase